MSRFTENKVDYLVAFETASPTPTIYERELIRLLRNRACVVTGYKERPVQRDLLLLVATTGLNQLDLDEASPVIILSDELPLNLPSAAIVLPAMTAPSSVLQVAQCLLSAAGERSGEHFGNALEGQARWIWSEAAKTIQGFEHASEPPRFEEALQSARNGTCAEVKADEILFRVTPWGTLQNGCVLQGYPSRMVDKPISPLKDWFEQFTSQAKAAGLKLNLEQEISLESWLPQFVNPDLLVAELARIEFKREVFVSMVIENDYVRMHFEQEKLLPRTDSPSNALNGVVSEDGTVGRRLSFPILPECKILENKLLSDF